MKVNKAKTDTERKKKEKERESELEKMIFQIMEKSLQKALKVALDELTKDWI